MASPREPSKIRRFVVGGLAGSFDQRRLKAATPPAWRLPKRVRYWHPRRAGPTTSVLDSLDFQPLAAHRAVGAKVRGRALEHHVAVAHDVDAVRNIERDGELLLNQNDRKAAPRNFGDQLAHLFYDKRRETL